MKNKLFKTGLLLMSSVTLGTALLPATTAFADSDFNIENKVTDDTDSNNLSLNPNESLVGQDDEYYYTVEEDNPLSRTWNKTTSHSIVKGKRTYLETVTVNKKSYLTISGKVLGMTIKIGSEYSESGKFKKYKQEAKITVRYNVYRKVDNKYVTSKTAVSNTYYIDYVATK